jgi:hypothetical protein
MAAVTKRRARRAAKKLEQQHRAAMAARNRLRPQRGGWFGEPPFPDDLDGGAGVREPRRPLPTMPAASMELELPVTESLDLTRSAAG